MADCDTGQCPPSEDPMDPKTFTPPFANSGELSKAPSVVIEFCNRCRWLHRATWVQTELFLTFPDTTTEQTAANTADGHANGDAVTASSSSNGGKYNTAGKGLQSITLIPCNAPETGGRFRVWLYNEKAKEEADSMKADGQNIKDGSVVLLWDRKIKGGFPELKELKQLIRDEIAPTHKLGHSDKKESR